MKHKFSRNSEALAAGGLVTLRCDRCHLICSYADQRIEPCPADTVTHHYDPARGWYDPNEPAAVPSDAAVAVDLDTERRLDSIDTSISAHEQRIADHERRLGGNSDRVRDIAQEHLHDIAELRREVAELQTELRREQRYRASLAQRVAGMEKCIKGEPL